MVYDIISKMNPWWHGEEDPHIRRWKEQEYRWIPDWIDKVSIKSFSLNFILGPRLVGKTTGIKLLINKLLEKIRPEKIIYISCDVLPDYLMLLNSLTSYLDRVNSENGAIYIFLDEATTLKEWWRALKPLIDAGIMRKTVVTVTGSSTLRIQRDVELFPGRRGVGTTIEVLPLSFPEYVRVHGLDKSELYHEKIRRLFDKYLDTGGFPPSINGQPIEDIFSAFIGEILRQGRSLEITREVISALISSAPSATSYRALATKTSGYSYKVVQNYLELLIDLYLINVAYLRQGNKVYYRKEKKFFFRDPLLLRLFSAWSGTPFIESAIYEHIVQEHIFRKYGKVFYRKNAYEIDIVTDELRIEVKAGKPHRRYPRNVKVIDRDQIPLFLLKL